MILIRDSRAPSRIHLSPHAEELTVTRPLDPNEKSDGPRRGWCDIPHPRISIMRRKHNSPLFAAPNSAQTLAVLPPEARPERVVWCGRTWA